MVPAAPPGPHSTLQWKPVRGGELMGAGYTHGYEKKGMWSAGAAQLYPPRAPGRGFHSKQLRWIPGSEPT